MLVLVLMAASGEEGTGKGKERKWERRKGREGKGKKGREGGKKGEREERRYSECRGKEVVQGS